MLRKPQSAADLSAGMKEAVTNLCSSTLMTAMMRLMAIMMAGSASFATPLGYQTNLMVLGPGGYRFSDFLKIGAPMNLLIGLTTVSITPFIWPF